MKKEHWLIALFFVLLSCATVIPAYSQPTNVQSGRLLWDSCGGEDDPACQPGMAAYPYLPGFNGLPKCDRTLDASVEGGIFVCRDKGRRKVVPEPAYTGTHVTISQQTVFQQADQFGRISADLPLNYVPIIGTHNSYSNYQDGGNNVLNVDQRYTITDQLQLGARHIRLDPIGFVFDGTPILCHTSPFNLKDLILPNNEQELCNTTVVGAGFFNGAMSYQRPFFYAVRELRHWLDLHPAEAVILRINKVGGSSFATDIAAILEHELQGKLVLNSDEKHMPTLRAIRAAGNQVLALSNKPYGPYMFQEPILTFSNDTSAAVFPICKDFSGAPTGLNRPFLTQDGFAHWPNIGEDRALANIFSDPLQQGLVGPLETEIATYCGYSMIGFDFFHSMDVAPNVYLPFIGRANFQGPTPDPRPQAAIWSWQSDAFLSVPMPAALEKPLVSLPLIPAFLTDSRTFRWKPLPDTTVLPFACAGIPDPTNPRLYPWRITLATGPWATGEVECQKLDPALHFWRPMSSIENQELVAVLKTAPAQGVWLNHYSGKTVALPADVEFSYPFPNAQAPKAVIMTSGLGGKFLLSFTPSNSTAKFLDIPASTGSPRIELQVSPTEVATLPAGDYTGVLSITEVLGASAQTSSVNVTMHLPRATGQLTSSVSAVTFVTGLQQQTTIQSTPGPATLLPPSKLPLWLSATLNQSTTPATLTLTADPSRVTGPQSFLLQLKTSTNGIQDLFLPVSIAVSQANLATAPTAIPITLDGGSLPSPIMRPWVVGSAHTLTVPLSYDMNGSNYMFDQWSDGVKSTTRTVTTTFLNLSLTASYTVSHRLTLVQPASGGTISVQGPTLPGSLYPQFWTLTLVATPANGFVFQRFSGDLQIQHSPALLIMDAPKTVTAIFVPSQGRTTILSTPPGRTLSVDGVNYTTPASFVWPLGEQHSVTAPAQTGAPGTRYSFTSWADGVTSASRTISGSVFDASFTAGFNPEYQVTTLASPAQSGTVTGGGWYAPGAAAVLTATASAGFRFANFTGATAIGNTAKLAVTQPVTIIGNFTATAAPVLYASSAGRTDLGGNVVRVALVLNNIGAGGAGDASITAIDSIQVPQGAGAVAVQFPPAGLPVGTILPGQRAQTNVDFVWPTSATRVTFTVRYSANGGAYRGANTITLFR